MEGNEQIITTGELSPIERLLEGARVKHVPAGQILFYEDDLPTEIYAIKAGVVRVYDIDDDGNDKILHLAKTPALVPFAFFSELVEPLKWYYSTLTDCDLFVFAAEDLISAVRSNGELAVALTQNFSLEVHEVLVRLSSLSKTNARDKVLAALKFLTVWHSTRIRAGWRRVNFAVNHQLVADLCGITRESAALVMKELQAERLARSPKQAILEINEQRLLKMQ